MIPAGCRQGPGRAPRKLQQYSARAPPRFRHDAIRILAGLQKNAGKAPKKLRDDSGGILLGSAKTPAGLGSGSAKIPT